MILLLSLNEFGGQVFILNATMVDPLVKSLKILINVGDSGLDALIHFGDVVLGGHKLNLNIGNTGVDFDQTFGLTVHNMLNNLVVFGNPEVGISTMSQDTIHDIKPCHRS